MLFWRLGSIRKFPVDSLLGMKKIFAVFISAVLVLSCSLSTPVATPSPVFTATNIPTDTLTSTPIPPTQTFTSTPTLAGQKTETPTPDAALTPLTVTPLFLITPDTATPAPQMKGFLTLIVSDEVFYKGSECQPTSVKFTAQVVDIGNTRYVLLFVRFKSKKTGVAGDWADSISMESIGAGTYVHDLVTTEMKNVDNFKNAWVEYQFVATNSRGREIGRTDTFSERLSLLECVATPTAEASPTTTALKP